MCPKKNITQLNLQALQNQAFTTSLTCQPSLVGINIDYCNLTNAGISPADLVIAGPGPLPANVDAACKPRILSLPDGKLTVTFLLFDILSCGVRTAMDQETITLSYDVRNMPPTTGVIQRYFDACITFNCTFNRTAQVDFSPIDPRIEKLALDAQSGAGRFDISMNLFRDENCTMPFQSIGANPPNVLVEEYIYFKASINRHNAHMVLQAPKCWATPTADPRSMQKYDIIQEGCASAMDKPNIKVVKNYETYYISAGVASFIWTNITDQRIYIHCEVDVCYNTSGSCSGPTCPSRRKRFVGQVNHPNSKLYSIGPLKIVSACDELEPQTCSQKCVVMNGKPRCSCMDGFYLSTDGRTCIFDGASLRNPVPIQSENFVSMNQILIFVLFMCVVCLIITRVRERKN
uniref:ZP domain-containing protein n=2 Tax=Ciona intestinalis TaxID=7719 RepID=F6Y8B5_CIOIN